MALSTLSRSYIGDKMPKKKQELPVFVVVDMPEWKTKILNAMLWILRIPGKAWVIGVEDTGFTYDGNYYTDDKTGLKISRKVVDKHEKEQKRS
jgi:hypothetical protein